MKKYGEKMLDTFMSEGAASANGVETLIKLGVVGAMGIVVFGIAKYAMDGANAVKQGVTDGSGILDGEDAGGLTIKMYKMEVG